MTLHRLVIKFTLADSIKISKTFDKIVGESYTVDNAKAFVKACMPLYKAAEATFTLYHYETGLVESE